VEWRGGGVQIGQKALIEGMWCHAVDSKQAATVCHTCDRVAMLRP
jgi:hypothetical protein